MARAGLSIGVRELAEAARVSIGTGDSLRGRPGRA